MDFWFAAKPRAIAVVLETFPEQTSFREVKRVLPASYWDLSANQVRSEESTPPKAGIERVLIAIGRQSNRRGLKRTVAVDFDAAPL